MSQFQANQVVVFKNERGQGEATFVCYHEMPETRLAVIKLISGVQCFVAISSLRKKLA